MGPYEETSFSQKSATGCRVAHASAPALPRDLVRFMYLKTFVTFLIQSRDHSDGLYYKNAKDVISSIVGHCTGSFHLFSYDPALSWTI